MATTTTTSVKRQAAATVKGVKDDVVESAKGAAADAKATGTRVKREAGALEDNLARSAEDLAANVGERLRAVGVDTDKMVDIAREQATDLQRLIVQEIQDRPLRALGLAAAVGVFVGFLSAR